MEYDDECDLEDDGTDEESTFDDEKGERTLSDSDMTKRSTKSAKILENLASPPLAGNFLLQVMSYLMQRKMNRFLIFIVISESTSDTDEDDSNDDDTDGTEMDDDEKIMERESDGLRSLIKGRMLVCEIILA